MADAVRGMEILSDEFGWHVLCVQEFSDSTSVPTTFTGHQVFCGPPSGRHIRRPAIVVHREFVAGIVGDPIYTDTAVAVQLTTETTGCCWIISSSANLKRKVKGVTLLN